MTTLLECVGAHCRITVTEEGGVRYLYLDGCEEGAMFVDSEDPVFNYLWFHKASQLARPVRRALVLGAGAFTAAKCLAIDHGDAAIDVVDLEPELLSVGRQFFNLAAPRYRSVSFIGERAEIALPRLAPSYDFIFDDLFDGFEHVPEATRGAAHVCRLGELLADDGIAIKNLIWDRKNPDTVDACSRMADAWRPRFAWSMEVLLGHPGSGHNRILLGAKKPRGYDWAALSDLLLGLGIPRMVISSASVESRSRAMPRTATN
jgi:spermidine synthase